MQTLQARSAYRLGRRVKGRPNGPTEDTERSGGPQGALDAPGTCRQPTMFPPAGLPAG
jgi:hypothetical protein